MYVDKCTYVVIDINNETGFAKKDYVRTIIYKY